MNDYIELRVDLIPCSEDMTDVLAALLADSGYESFVADERGLTAYVKKELYADDLSAVRDCFPFDAKMKITATEIEGRDWNHEWEKNYFKPIVVDGRCVIHSSFHTDIPECEYDIVIDPKMAFGTGHHSTTSLIIRRLLAMDLCGKRVLDMGTGTGILAILAMMRGAAEATGIEIDPAAYVNAVENCRLNGCAAVRLIEGDASALATVESNINLLMANINRNVITADIDKYVSVLADGADVLLSGFYVADIPIVRAAAEAVGLKYVDFTEQKEWACVHMVNVK